MSASWADQKSKKSSILKCRLLLFYTTMNHFSIRLWCATKSGFYTANRNDQLSHWTRKKLQSTSQRQNCSTKRLGSLFGGLLLVCSTTASWILVTPLHLRSMLSKLVRWTENCNACSWHWPIEWAQFSTQHLTTRHTTDASKVEQIGLQSFVPSAIFTWPLTNWLPLFKASKQLFAGKMLLQPAGGRKWVCQIPKHGFLHYRNKQIYFFLAKMCWL